MTALRDQNLGFSPPPSAAFPIKRGLDHEEGTRSHFRARAGIFTSRVEKSGRHKQGKIPDKPAGNTENIRIIGAGFPGTRVREGRSRSAT